MLLAVLFSLVSSAGSPIAEPHMNVTYSKAGGMELKMDVYPAVTGEKVAGPAVVMIHGGAWVAGRREDMAPLAKVFTEKGLTVANIQYRLGNQTNKWPAMLDDVQTAVRYLRANAAKYNIDPNRIGATGASAGGHLAMFLGVMDTRDPKPAEFPEHSSRVRAVFNFFGPCDMSQPFPPIMDGIYEMVLGKKKVDAAAEIKSASPINYVDKLSAPMFIYQGNSDPLVKPEQAKIAEAKYKSLGLICEVRFLDGVAHEIKATDAGAQKAVADGIEFLKKHLGPTQTLIDQIID